MKNKQGGFTLVEIAIVLVIIGLLLGGVLKGQELKNSAKVKNMASDFRNVQVMIYGYQDKYKRLPGDDNTAIARWTLAASHEGDGNGVVGGKWNDTTVTESVLLWEHLRRGNLASGLTDFSSAAAIKASLPTNSEGGMFGLSGTMPIKNMNGGTFYACSDGIDGKFARQLDLTLDDGVANTGSIQSVAFSAAGATQADGTAVASATYVDGTRYTACMTY